MVKRIALMALALGIVAACQPRQPVVATTAPVVAAEPVFQGKYGAN